MSPDNINLQHRIEIVAENLCVIIPTYNNGNTVCDVVERAYKQCKNIIVVNDGSTDDTAGRLEGFALNHHVTVISHPQNRGKGQALISGFHKAVEQGFKYAITIDSDGQHYPEDIPVLVEAEAENPSSMIIGSRSLGGKDMSGGSRFANKFSNFWFMVQTGKYLPDTQTGYRLYPLHKMKWLSIVTSRYESELELMVFASWHGVELIPVSINVYYPKREERISHFRPFYDFARISLLNTVLCLGAVLYGYPRRLLLRARSIAYTVFSLVFFLVGALVLTIFVLLYLGLFKNTEKKRHNYHRLLCGIARFVVKHIPGTSFTLNNPHGETFEKPAIIISNHQSHFDLMCAMMLTPKLVILTKKWVWNNPFYGFIIRFAEFYPIMEGTDSTVEYIQNVVRRGYSVLIYPEGTRSEDCSIQHFHRGAFYFAEQLGLDILPIIEYGPGHVLPKKGWTLRPGCMRVDVMRRILPDDKSFGDGFREQAKRLNEYYKKEYQLIEDFYVL